jgi:cytochrome oxidase Cu insertion factor (SCO1/SenC/PrrC family)
MGGADYAVDHSTLLYVIDRTGRLRLIGRSDGPTDDLLHDLKVLADEAPAKP